MRSGAGVQGALHTCYTYMGLRQSYDGCHGFEERNDMAAIGRLIKLAQSPQGRRLISEAQKAARDPKNRERLAKVRTTIEERLPKRSAAEPVQKQPPGAEPSPPRHGEGGAR